MITLAHASLLTLRKKDIFHKKLTMFQFLGDIISQSPKSQPCSLPRLDLSTCQLPVFLISVANIPSSPINRDVFKFIQLRRCWLCLKNNGWYLLCQIIWCLTPCRALRLCSQMEGSFNKLDLTGKLIIKATFGQDIRRIPIHNDDLT